MTTTKDSSSTDLDLSKAESTEDVDHEGIESSHSPNPAVVVSPDTNDHRANEDNKDGQLGKRTRNAKESTEHDDPVSSDPPGEEPTKNDNDHDHPNHNSESNNAEDEDNNDDNESHVEAAKTRESTSLPRPPLRPIKRARTAYFIFTDEKRPQVQAEHPGEGVAGVARIMGQMWSTLPAEEKEKYQQQAARERDRVAKELEDYKAAGGILPEDTTEGTSKADKAAATTSTSTNLIYPVARIRKICKLDPEVRGVSKEALWLITKCAELATAKLGHEAVRVAQIQNRRKLLPDDVAHVCSHREQFLFLKDDIKDLVKESLPPANHKPAPGAGHKKADSVKEQAAVGSKPLTSYFAAAPK